MKSEVKKTRKSFRSVLMILMSLALAFGQGAGYPEMKKNGGELMTTPNLPLSLKPVIGTDYELSGANTGSAAVNLPLLSSGTVGDYGLYYYAASGSGSGVQLTPMTLAYDEDYGGNYWSYVSGIGREARIAPLMYDGIGVIAPSDDKYPVIGLKAPRSGTMLVGFNATGYPAAGSDGFTFQLTRNGFAAGDTLQPDANNHYWVSVKKGDMLYFVFKTNGTTIEGDHSGYYAYFAYTEIQNLEDLAWDINLEPIGADDSGQTSVVHDDVNDTYIFSYNKDDLDIAYYVDYGSANVEKGLIEVTAKLNDNDPITAVSEAGTYYLPLNGQEMNPKAFSLAANTQMTATFDNDKLILNYTDTYEGVSNQKTYTFSIRNKTLIIHAQSGSVNGKGGYSAFGTGKSEATTTASMHTSVYVEEVSVTLADNTYFLSAYLDKAKTFGTSVGNNPSVSGKSTVHGMTAHYELNSAGETNPLDEYLYVTVSDEFLDCVYLTNAEKSDYRDSLSDKIVYDTWEFHSTYQERKKHYEMLAAQYGMEDMLLIDHRWQRDKLDISNPAFYPASTAWGSANSFRNYVDTVKNNLDWKFALHEDYWFMYPSTTNQYWNAEGVEDKIAQDASGNFRYGWLTTSYANKSDAMLEYAQIESSLIKGDYGTDAAFLDVNGGVDPSDMNQVTLNAESGTSRTLAQVVADNVALFEGMKDIYQGPIMSEGAQGARSFGSAYAGHIDAIERELTGINNGKIMPDYELKYIRPLMANQGMGYPARFQPDARRYAYELSGADTGSGAVNLPQLSSGTVGDYGLYYYAASGSGSGVDLTPMTLAYDEDYGGEYWSYVSGSGREAMIAPLMYDGIGVADPSDDKYPVIGLKAPETGTMLVGFNATGYPAAGSDGFTFKLTRNGFAAGQTIQPDENNQYWVSVTKGDMIYFVFKTNGTSVEGDRSGYYAYFAYTDIQKPIPLEPAATTNYELSGADTGSGAVNLPLLAKGTVGDYGLHYYAASGSGSGVELTPMKLAYDEDYGGEYWSYVGGSGREARIAPLMYDGIGVVAPSDDKYPVIGWEAPETGNLFVNFNATAYPAAGSDGFTFQLTRNGFAAGNVLLPDGNNQYWISVTKGDMLYFVFKTNGTSVEGDHSGYYAYFAYSTIDNLTPPPVEPLALQAVVGTTFDFDKYNAASIAYGHTGFIGELHHGIVEQQVNTYYMFKALQPQYLNTAVDVEQVTYFDMSGTPLNLNEAIKSNYNFAKARLYITYSNGLAIYLNFSDSNWNVSLNGNAYVLDKNGYVAENPSIDFVQYSCLLDGVRVDYVDSAQYTYANPRNNMIDFGGGLVTDELTIINK